jgi:hypothetical protein
MCTDIIKGAFATAESGIVGYSIVGHHKHRPTPADPFPTTVVYRLAKSKNGNGIFFLKTEMEKIKLKKRCS